MINLLYIYTYIMCASVCVYSLGGLTTKSPDKTLEFTITKDDIEKVCRVPLLPLVFAYQTFDMDRFVRFVDEWKGEVREEQFYEDRHKNVYGVFRSMIEGDSQMNIVVSYDDPVINSECNVQRVEIDEDSIPYAKYWTLTTHLLKDLKYISERELENAHVEFLEMYGTN
jgi:hypothetical protein